MGIAGIFLAIVAVIWTLIARSIRVPLDDLAGSMNAIVAGDLARQPSGLSAADDLGRMARAVEVFRQNAIEKQKAERDLVAAKNRAETALSELRDTQQSLVEAEKLAASAASSPASPTRSTTPSASRSPSPRRSPAASTISPPTWSAASCAARASPNSCRAAARRRTSSRSTSSAPAR